MTKFYKGILCQKYLDVYKWVWRDCQDILLGKIRIYTV